MKNVMIIGAGAQGNVISGLLASTHNVATILLGDIDMDRANEVVQLRSVGQRRAWYLLFRY